ncbi:MAG: type III-B CRISPR module-associated protein Cmr5 [Nitrososphaerota archaeon]
MSMNDQVLSAIMDFEYLLNLLEKKEKSEVGKSFRSRCRELPNLIEDFGFVPAVSFCYAKAGKTNYDKMKDVLETKSKINDENYMEKGYAIYLYFVLKRLKDLKLIDEAHLNDPIKAFEELRKGKQRIASRLLRPYIVQLKQLSEAVFEVEEAK